MPRLRLHFENAPPGLDARRIAEAIESADLPASDTLAATIRFVSPGEMAQMNERFKGGSGPTNVLTFANGSCADIAVCRQVAAVDAREGGWSLFSELTYLCVHGCLHALGFDHGDRARAEEMESLERRILDRIGGEAHRSGP